MYIYVYIYIHIYIYIYIRCTCSVLIRPYGLMDRSQYLTSPGLYNNSTTTNNDNNDDDNHNINNNTNNDNKVPPLNFPPYMVPTAPGLALTIRRRSSAVHIKKAEETNTNIK